MNDAEDMVALAAELAWGLLDREERAVAEARLARDPAFAAEHALWLDRGAAWLDGPPVTPPASVWAAIERRLPANDGVRRTALRWWQASTAIASAAAVVLGMVAWEQRAAPPVAHPAARPMVAMLTGDGEGRVALWFDRDGGLLTAAPAKINVGHGSAELWVIPAGGKPRSLGVVPASPGAVHPPRDALALLSPGATVAISREPFGGSPTGQPTGPVILTGTLLAT